MAVIKMPTNHKCWRGRGEKGTLPYTVGGNANWCSHYGKQYGGSSKTKNRAATQSGIPLLGMCVKKDKNSNMKSYVHPTVHSSTVYSSWHRETTQAPNHSLRICDIYIISHIYIYVPHFIYVCIYISL